jgi:N6-adenosine-specific RNA methylase IME4
LALNLEQVPVEVKVYENELSEKRGILEYNRQREKTTSQRVKEAKLIKEIITEEALSHKQTTSKYAPRNDKGQLQPVPLKSSQPVNTAEIIGRQVGIGGEDKYRKAEKIYDKAQDGDEQAQSLLKDIDAGEKTINRAFRELEATKKREAFVSSRQEIPQGVFDIIYADCPWRYEFSEISREVENQYPTMTLQELRDLRLQLGEHINDIAVLFLWATAPKLLEALDVMKSWGFSYRTHAIWDKEKFGMGYWFRGQHELLLVGTKGNYPPPTQKVRFSSVIRETRINHSTKPQRVYEIIEAMCPKSKYLELFARSKRRGWESWGNEVE